MGGRCRTKKPSLRGTVPHPLLRKRISSCCGNTKGENFYEKTECQNDGDIGGCWSLWRSYSHASCPSTHGASKLASALCQLYWPLCCMLASVLGAAGYRTGLYTSPHLFRVNERMSINGAEISNEALTDAAAAVRDASAGMTGQPTEFEIITAMALYYFCRERCDLVVLEVGWEAVWMPPMRSRYRKLR